MATAPRRAPVSGVQEQDHAQGQEDDPFLDEGTDGEGEDGGGSPGETEDDAALDDGEEQETGGEEDLEFDDARVERVAGRATTRIQRLRGEVDDLRRQLAQRSTTEPVQLRPPAEETDEQFTARIQLLPPDERMEQRQIRFERRAEQRQNFAAFQQAENLDRTNWNAACTASPRRQRLSAEVEAEHTKLLQQGRPVDRETIYYYLLGKLVDSPRGQREVKRRTERAQERVRRAETRPTGAGSDVASRRGRTDERTARARRLENMQI